MLFHKCPNLKLYLSCVLFVLATLSVIGTNIFSVVHAYDFDSSCDSRLKNAPLILGITNFVYVIVAMLLVTLVVIHAKSFRMEENTKAIVIFINLIYNLGFLIIGGVMLKDSNCLTESLVLIGIPVSLMIMFMGYVLVDLEQKRLEQLHYEIIVST